jgi:hypothetical protein
MCAHTQPKLRSGVPSGARMNDTRRILRPASLGSRQFASFMVLALLVFAIHGHAADTTHIITISNAAHLPLTLSVSYTLTNVDTAPALLREPLPNHPVDYALTNHSCTVEAQSLATLNVPSCRAILNGVTMTNGRSDWRATYRSENVTITNSQTWLVWLYPFGDREPFSTWNRDVIPSLAAAGGWIQPTPLHSATEGAYYFQNMYSTLILELKGGQFRYWFSSDVRGWWREPTYPLHGSYTTNGGTITLSQKEISQTNWTFMTYRGQPTLWRPSALTSWDEARILDPWGVLYPATEKVEEIWERKGFRKK